MSDFYEMQIGDLKDQVVELETKLKEAEEILIELARTSHTSQQLFNWYKYHNKEQGK